MYKSALLLAAVLALFALAAPLFIFAQEEEGGEAEAPTPEDLLERLKAARQAASGEDAQGQEEGELPEIPQGLEPPEFGPEVPLSPEEAARLAAAREEEETPEEKERNEEEVISRYRTLLYQKPFHQWAFDKLFRIYVEKNRVNELVSEYEELSKNNSEEDPYHVVLVRLYEKVDKYEQAENALQRIKEKSQDALLLSARIYRNRKKFAEAANALEEAAANAQAARDLKKIYNELGLIYTASGDREKAKTAWAKIKSLAPENYYNVKKLAELYRSYHYYDEALAEYEALVGLAGGESSRLAEIYKSVGEIHERKGAEKEAIQSYEKGIALMARGNWLRTELEKRVVALYRKADKLAELEERIRTYLKDNAQDIGSYEMLAEVYEAQKKSESAAEILREAIKLYPKDTVLSEKLRGVYSRMDETEGLIAEYRRIISENPEKTELYIELGKVLASDKRFEEAKREWEHALQKQLKGAAFAAKLASLYTEYGLLDEAIAMYERAIEIAPKERSRYTELGDVYLKKNEPDNALAAWKRMTQADPNDASAWSDLSSVLKANGYYAESLSAIDEAVRLSPENYKHLFDKAGILLLLKKQKEAAELYRQVAATAKEEYHRDESIAQVVNLSQREKILGALIGEEKERDDEVSRCILAQAYERLMEYPRAREIYSLILEKNPNAKSVLESLARVLVRMQQYLEAQNVYERLLLLNPGKARSYYRSLLAISLEMGEEEKAVALTKRMMDKSPTNPVVYKEAGETFLRLDRPQEALEAFQQATRLKGDDAEYWTLLADALSRLERDEEAVAALVQAVTLAKDNQKRFQVIGRIYDLYTRLGRLEEEIERLKQEVDNDPYETGNYVFLSEFLSRNMEYAEAIDFIGRALELKKEEALFHEIMARLYEGMEDFKGAVQEYEDALSLPDADRTRLVEAWCSALVRAGEKEKAAAEISQIGDRRKSVSFLIRNKLYDEAADELKDAIGEHPLDDKYHSLLAEVLQAKGEKENAIESLKIALEIKPAQKEYLSKLASLYFEIGDKKSATFYAGQLFGAELREKEEEEEDRYSYYSYRYWWYGSRSTGLEAVWEVFYFFVYRGMIDEFRQFYEEELARQPNNVLLRLVGIQLMSEVSGCEELTLRTIRELLRMQIDQESIPVRYLIMGDVKDGLRFRLARLYSDKPSLRAKEMAQLEKQRESGTTDAELLLELSAIYDIERKKEESLAVLSEAEKLAPEIPIVVLAKARMHESRCEWEEAKKCYEKFLFIIESRESLQKRCRNYFRAMVKDGIPAELKNVVSQEIIEYLTEKQMARPWAWSYDRERLTLPDKRSTLRCLARVAKAAGKMDEAKKYLARMEPEDEKSPISAVSAAAAYKEFELRDDAARMCELELEQWRYRKKLLGTLGSDRYYYDYGERIDWAQELVEHYRKKERYLEALDIALELGTDVKALLSDHKLFEPGKKMYEERLAALWQKPESERDTAEYRENVVRLADLLAVEKRYDEIESLYKFYLEKFPDDTDFLVPYSVCLENKERLAEALEVMKKAAKLAQEREDERKRHPRVEPVQSLPPVPPLKEADSYYYDDWSRYSRRYGAAASGVGSAECAFTIARLCAKLGDKKEAVKAIKDYFVESRKSSYYSYGSSDSLEQFIERFGLEDEMVPVYRTVMILYPHDTETQIMYGKYLEKKERYEEAVKIYEKVLRMSRGGYYGYYGEARLPERLERLYKKLKREALTFEQMKKEVEENPKNVKANARLTVYYFLSGQIEKAAEQGEKTVALAPYLTALHRLLFYTSRILGDEEKALKHLEAEIALTQEESAKRSLYTSYGGMLYFSGSEHKAIETWKKMAVADDARTNRYLGDLFTSLGIYEIGAQYLEKAMKGQAAYRWWGGTETAFRAFVARMLAGDFDKAAQSLMELLENRIKDASQLSEGLINVANCAERLGKLPQLEEMLNKKAEENADQVEWWTLLQSFYSRREDKKKEKEICQRIAELRPNETEPLISLMSFALDEKDYDEAFRLADKIFEVAKKEQGSAFTGASRPADYMKTIEKEYHSRRASIFAAMKKKEEAVAELKKNVEEDKPETIMALAQSLSSYKYNGEALEATKEYLRVAKAKTAYDYRFYAGLLREELLFDEAIQSLETAAAMAEQSYYRRDDFYSIFQIHIRLGTIPTFIEKMKKYVTEHPEETSVHEIIFDAYQRISDTDGAIAYARELWEKDTARIESAERLASLLMEKEQYAETVELLRKVLEKNPPNPQRMYGMLAQCYFKMKDKPNAFEYLKKSTERYEEPQISYAAALLRGNYTEEALDALLPIWDERSDDSYYNLLVAAAAYKLQKWDIALGAVQRSFLFEEWYDIDYTMRANLRLLYQKTGAGEKIIACAEENPDNIAALKRLYLYHITQNDKKKAFESARCILQKEPYTLTFIYAALSLAHQLGEREKALDAAIRLACVLENGGTLINKRLLKKYLLTTARGDDPLSAISQERLFYSRGEGLDEYIGNLVFKKGETEKALSWWKRLLYSGQGDYYFYGESVIHQLVQIYINNKLYAHAREILKSADLFQSYYYRHYSVGDEALEARMLREEGKTRESVNKYIQTLEKRFEGYGDSSYSYYRDDALLREFVNLLRDERQIDEFYEIARSKAKEDSSSGFYRLLFEKLVYEKRDKGALPESVAMLYKDDPDSIEALQKFLECYRTIKDYNKMWETGKKLLAKFPEERKSVLLDMFVAAGKLGKTDEKTKFEQEYLCWNTVKEDYRYSTIFERAVEEELYSDALKYAQKILAKEAEEEKKRAQERKGEETEEEEKPKYSLRDSSSLKKLYEKLGMEKEKAELEAREKDREEKFLKDQKEKIQKNPFNSSPYWSLYNHYLSSSELDKASESLVKMEELFGSAAIYYDAGLLWFRKGDPVRALSAFLDAEKEQESVKGLPASTFDVGSWLEGDGWSPYSRWTPYDDYEEVTIWSPGSFWRRPYWRYGGWSYPYYSYSSTDFSYSAQSSLLYDIAMCYHISGNEEKSKEYFRKARSKSPNSVFRLFADYVLDGKAVDWEVVKEVLDENYKYYEKDKDRYEK